MSNQKSNQGKNKSDYVRYLGVASTVGINMVASTFVGFAIGYWLLDENLNTLPWFTIIFTLLGIAAGFIYLFRIAMKQRDNGDSEGST